VIVGGGFTGLSAGLELRRVGIDVMIIEGAEPGWGASGRNSGLVIPTLTRPDPDDIVAKYGSSGERFVTLLRDSASHLFQTADGLGLAGQTEQNGWLQPAHTAGRMAIAERRYKQWAKWGAPVDLLDRDQVRNALGSAAWHGAFFNRSGGTVNPLALVRAMATAVTANGARIYVRTPALHYHRSAGNWIVTTPAGAIKARALLLATNAYTGELSPDLAPSIAKEIVPVVSWLTATAPLDEETRRTVIPSRTAMSDTRGDLYFARYDVRHRLITGGSLVSPFNRAERLKSLIAERLVRLWPQLKSVEIEFVWNGLIGITPDRFPRFHQLGPDAYAWAGCNGRAVALSVAVGRELARAIAGVPLTELAIPFSEPSPLHAHGLVRRLAPLALIGYRRRDAKELA